VIKVYNAVITCCGVASYDELVKETASVTVLMTSVVTVEVDVHADGVLPTYQAADLK